MWLGAILYNPLDTCYKHNRILMHKSFVYGISYYIFYLQIDVTLYVFERVIHILHLILHEFGRENSTPRDSA